MRRSSSGALEHCVQEHGMFGNVLMENCQTVADLETPRSMVEQQLGGEVPLLLFLCTPSLAARRCMESYVCRKTRVYGLWPFFFQMGSLSNNMCLIQIWNHLGEDLPANQQRCLGGQCCPWGWSDTSIRSHGWLPCSWYGRFFCCEFSVMCSQIGMAMGHTSHRDAGI